MKLEDYIKESITQIIKGIKATQEFASDNGAKVNPENIRQSQANGNAYSMQTDGQPVQVIDFDLSITTKEDGETSGSAGIFVAAFKLGIEGKDGKENIISNRIKFSVPILFPTQE